MISFSIDDLPEFNPSKQPVDIEITFHNKGRLLLHFLKWDNDFFKIPSYRADFTNFCCNKISPEETKLMRSSLKPSFITAVCDHSQNTRLVRFLHAWGFRYIETGIILHFKEFPGRQVSPPEGFIIKKVEDLTGLDLEPLGQAFDLTRFHADHNIGQGKADELWVQYLKNFIPSDKKHAFLAFSGNTPVGGIFINLYDDTEGTSTADLFVVAVLKEFTSKGIGSLLARHALLWAEKHSTQIMVGTQARNVPALNYYIKNGFTSVYKTTSIFHRWA